MTEVELHDSRGKAFEPLAAGPLRLVSLVPSTTESLFALGRGADLVGYTRFCVHPEGQVLAEKWIGGTKNPKIEQIIALEPDLVLANREENRQEDVAALEAAGLAVWVAAPRTVVAAIADLRQMGILVGRGAEANAIAEEIERVLVRTQSIRFVPPRTVAYLIWREPYMAAGQETFIADMVAQAGYIIPFAGRYPELSLTDLRSADEIWLASEPYPFAAKHIPDFVKLGIPATNIRLVDGELLSWHGVRMGAGLRYLQTMRG